MKKIFITTTFVLPVFFGTHAFAQQTQGTLVMVAGTGEVKAENDQAVATFLVEEQNKDKTTAASQVNAQMKEGTAIIKKTDPNAKLATRGYYSYPVYSDASSARQERLITGWRVGQYVDVTTKNLQQLSTTVAAAQKVLALNGISFGLSDETQQRLDAARLEAAYKNMQERAHIIATAMGRNLNDARIEQLDIDSVGASHPEPRTFSAASMAMKSNMNVAETSFEPGESTLNTRIVAKIKFN